MRLTRRETLLTNRASECIFETADSIESDSSLAALIRAIIIRHNKEATPEYINTRSALYISEFDDSLTYYLSDEFADKKVWIVFNAYKKLYPDLNADWLSAANNMYLKAVELFLCKFIATDIYQNPKDERVIMFVHGSPTRPWVQAIDSALFRILPWYFDDELTSEERAFFKSLSPSEDENSIELSKQSLIKFCNDAAELYDLRKQKVSKLLSNYSQRLIERQISRKEEYLYDISTYIQDLLRNIDSKYEEYDEVSNELKALKTVAPDSNDAMVRFFETHKCLDILEIYDDRLKYCVTDTLDYYNFDEAKTLLTNENGWFLRSFGTKFAALMIKLFVERRGIINVTSVFELTNLRSVSPMRETWFQQNAMPNPHIYYFGCNGANDKYYRQYAESGDWDLAIEQSISATKNWNIGDSTVGNKMFQWLLERDLGNNNEKFIWYKDGEPMEDINGATLITLAEFKERMAKRG